MKLYGDVSEEHKELAKELEEMEIYFDAKALKGELPVELLAKGYVCGAYDWFSIDCDEEGTRLLEKAEKVCPGYFNRFMIQQAREDKDFDVLVRYLTSELAYLLLDRLNGIKNGSST